MFVKPETTPSQFGLEGRGQAEDEEIPTRRPRHLASIQNGQEKVGSCKPVFKAAEPW